MPDPSSRRSNAEELFDDYLSRRESGEEVDFEAVCGAHPHLAAELRGLHAGAEAMLRARQGSLGQRLKQAVGPDLDPTLSLEPEPQPDSGSSSKVYEKLRTEAPRGTRYKLLGEIARGGMGAIIRIWDDELRRTLAMKVVLGGGVSPAGKPQSIHPRLLARFVEEAQVTGQLDHPGIVPVHELGIGSDGRAYFTMRLVKGEDLGKIFQHVRTGQEGWSQMRALGVMLKVCEAMSYAHSKRVLHRDLKPANIMVGKFGEVYVMDWGLARIQDREDKHDLRIVAEPAQSLSAVDTERHEERAENPDSPLVTMDGQVIGTPSFMSPEQAKGQLGKLGARSDVYAVGAMLYQLISGQAPFAPPDARVTQLSILMRLVEGPPRPLFELVPQAQAELIAITEKAMGREISDRYATMQELADDLRAYIEGRVVLAYETGAWAEARKWVKRNKSLAAALAAALLAVVLGAVAFKIKADQAQLARAEAEQKTNDLLSLSTSKDLEELVKGAGKLWPAQPAMIEKYEEWLSEAHALIDGHPADPARAVKQRPSLEEHKAKLAQLRQRATKQSAQDAKTDRESHARFGELSKLRAKLTWYSRMLGLEPWPSEAQVAAQLAQELLPRDVEGLDTIVWHLLDPEEPAYGEEVRALLLAQRALALDSEELRAQMLLSLAWADFRLCRLDDALAESARAIDETPESRLARLEKRSHGLKQAVESWSGESALAERRGERDALQARVSNLDRVVSERRTWTFENPEDAWWQVQLSTLVSDLETLRDPERGLMGDTSAEPFGWGVGKRYEFAKSIRERSIDSPQAKQRWTAAIAAIAASPKYGGLKLSPQVGLLPIGEDPQSRLWEFADFQAGSVPERGLDGRLKLTAEMGLVFVLIPAGSFWMGAQRTDPSGRNFDPAALREESPVHEVLLSAYFLSKYEMTQGQWIKVVAQRNGNPGAHRRFQVGQCFGRLAAPASGRAH